MTVYTISLSRRLQDSSNPSRNRVGRWVRARDIAILGKLLFD